jgi:hypothetical protein
VSIRKSAVGKRDTSLILPYLFTESVFMVSPFWASKEEIPLLQVSVPEKPARYLLLTLIYKKSIILNKSFIGEGPMEEKNKTISNRSWFRKINLIT